MKAWKAKAPIYWDIEGISLHQYTWGAMPFNEPATGFGEKEYANVLQQTMGMERTIKLHSDIMDKYDPKKKVSLVVDEWGVWLKGMPGTEPLLPPPAKFAARRNCGSHEHQYLRPPCRPRAHDQHRADGECAAGDDPDRRAKMVLTPTYHVYKMYVPFQDATLLPVTLNAGEYRFDKIVLPKVDAIAARSKDGKVWLALTNLDPNNAAQVPISVAGVAARSASGEVLTAERVDAINTFEAPNAVAPRPLSATAEGGSLVLRLPPRSVAVVRLEP